MNSRILIIIVVALQWGAATTYLLRRQWAQGTMFLGAGLANAAALFLPKA